MKAARYLGDLQAAGWGMIPQQGQRKNFLIYASISLAVLIGFLWVTFAFSIPDRDKALGTIVKGLLWGGVYALIALGVVVVFKASKVFNLAHGGVLLFLTYFVWWLSEIAHVPLPVATLVIVPLSAVAIGLGIDRFLMRKMIGDSGLATFLMTLILGFTIIQGFTVLIFGGSTEVMPQIFPSGTLSVGSASFPYALLFSFIAATVMFLLFVYYFRYTRGGLAMRCVSEDNIVSQSLGINVKRIYSIAWVVGCLSAFIGGLLLSSLTALFSDNMGLGGFAIMRALPVLLLGGLESIPGAYVGAIIIGLTERLSATYIDPTVPEFKAVLPYVLMVAILLIRPHGLFGQKAVRRL